MGQAIGPSSRQGPQQPPGRNSSAREREGGRDYRERGDGRPREGDGPQPPWMGAAGGGGSKRVTMTAADVEAERQAMQEQFRKAKSMPARRVVCHPAQRRWRSLPLMNVVHLETLLLGPLSIISEMFYVMPNCMHCRETSRRWLPLIGQSSWATPSSQRELRKSRRLRLAPAARLRRQVSKSHSMQTNSQPQHGVQRRSLQLQLQLQTASPLVAAMQRWQR